MIGDETLKSTYDDIVGMAVNLVEDHPWMVSVRPILFVHDEDLTATESAAAAANNEDEQRIVDDDDDANVLVNMEKDEYEQHVLSLVQDFKKGYVEYMKNEILDCLPELLTVTNTKLVEETLLELIRKSASYKTEIRYENGQILEFIISAAETPSAISSAEEEEEVKSSS